MLTHLEGRRRETCTGGTSTSRTLSTRGVGVKRAIEAAGCRRTTLVSGEHAILIGRLDHFVKRDNLALMIREILTEEYSHTVCTG